MFRFAQLAALTCVTLTQLATTVLETQAPLLYFDPNPALVQGIVSVEDYNHFEPSEDYKRTYNQTLYILKPAEKFSFEIAIGKRCKNAFLLNTDSQYDRSQLYVDSHYDMVDLYVVSGRMQFFKHNCAGRDYFQLQDSRIFKEECTKLHMITLEPCSHLYHDASSPHSVTIQELVMSRFICIN